MPDTGINWRTIGVKRERKYEELLVRLNSGGQNIFQYIKDLMVFAAMVGYSEGKREILHGDTIEINLDTYSSDEKDGFIYLLALMESRDGSCLKDENLHASVKVFEEYCNAGLAVLQGWLDSANNDPSGVDTLMDKIFNQLTLNERDSVIENESIELDL